MKANRNTNIAVHEAGHSIISRVLGVKSGGAVIDGEPFAYCDDGDDLASLLVAMAGCAAEVELLNIARGTEGDKAKVMRLVDKLGVDSELAWRITRQLVRLHRERIFAVATRLLHRGKLTGPEIDRIARLR